MLSRIRLHPAGKKHFAWRYHQQQWTPGCTCLWPSRTLKVRGPSLYTNIELLTHFLFTSQKKTRMSTSDSPNLISFLLMARWFATAYRPFNYLNQERVSIYSQKRIGIWKKNHPVQIIWPSTDWKCFFLHFTFAYIYRLCESKSCTEERYHKSGLQAIIQSIYAKW